jgi:hypothetical protein
MCLVGIAGLTPLVVFQSVLGHSIWLLPRDVKVNLNTIENWLFGDGIVLPGSKLAETG